MKHFVLFIGLCASAIFTQSAIAGGYFGVKGATVNVNSSAYNKDAINAGLLVGADFSSLGSNVISLEGDFTRTLLNGRVSGLDWDIQTFGLYAAMRTGSDVYLKAKAGYVESTGKYTSSADGLSYGFGFGMNNYEIEYTVIKAKKSGNADITMLSLAYLF